MGGRVGVSRVSYNLGIPVLCLCTEETALFSAEKSSKTDRIVRETVSTQKECMCAGLLIIRAESLTLAAATS